MKSKIVKLGGGLVGGSGAVALIVGFVNTKDQAVRDYVNHKHSEVILQVKNLEKGQDEIKDLLKLIDRRLYNLKTGE